MRCPECDTGLPGKMTDYFEMCGIYYCSTACVKAARLANVFPKAGPRVIRWSNILPYLLLALIRMN